MTRHYGHRIAMTATDATGGPRSFIWRERTYHVRTVLTTWHLRDRWWSPDSDGMRAPSDRYYYRVCCLGGLLCDLYYDAAAGVWALDRVHD